MAGFAAKVTMALTPLGAESNAQQDCCAQGSRSALEAVGNTTINIFFFIPEMSPSNSYWSSSLMVTHLFKILTRLVAKKSWFLDGGWGRGGVL